MVLKTETCRFSGLRMYPGHGMKYIRQDNQIFLFLSAKCKHLYNQRKKPAKLAWTFAWRKAHKKDQSQEVSKRRKKKSANSVTRSIASASLEVIKQKRSEKTHERAAARDAALREIKERTRKLKDEKKAKKTSEQKKAVAPAAKLSKTKGGKR
mmetsp:Transcript_23737/g.80868  ORF Transcript_23737/g.80868 Transcript_23737/m.80868 type:complete len:153 (+) Transcript_23737:245-703(+)